MKECRNQKQNLANCNCSYAAFGGTPPSGGGEPCPRKGICCECILYHRRNKELPACYFPPEIEKTFDRSITNFQRMSR